VGAGRVRRAWILSIAAVAVLIVLAALLHDPEHYLPGAWFMLAVVVAGNVGGWPLSAVVGVLGVIGTWFAVSDPRWSFEVVHARRIVALAGFAAAVVAITYVHHRRDRQAVQEQQARARADALRSLGMALATAVDPRDVARAAIAHVRPAVGADGVMIAVLDEGERRLEWLALAGLPEEVLSRFPSMPLDEPSSATDAVRTGRPVVVDDVQRYYAQYPNLEVRLLDATMWGFWPLLAGDRPLGALGLLWLRRRSLDDDDRVFLDTVTDLCSQSLRRAQVFADEQQLARALQRAVIPRVPAQLQGCDLAAAYLPATSSAGPVGGDWYDAFVLPGGSVFLGVGDVVGHGLVAAEDMVAVRSAARAYAIEGHRPARILSELRELVRSATHERFATMAVLLLDPESGHLAYALAGHPPPMVLRATTVEFLEGATGPPLGVHRDDARYSEGATSLGSGDVLVLYTDGLIERRTESIDAGLDRLRESLETWGDPTTAPLDGLCRHAIDRCLRDVAQQDDVCLLAARPRLAVPAVSEASAAPAGA
jgi:hypothetical protein